MYFDRKNGRILLRDGTVLNSSFGIAKDIIEGKDRDIAALKVMSDVHSMRYDELNHTDISHEVEDIYPMSTDHNHSEADLMLLLEMIATSPRYKETEKYIDRINLELDYFERSRNIMFILRCKELIEQFKRDKIVYGVGRGSSCASLVLYILEITDVDPVKYNIRFSELSKEY